MSALAELDHTAPWSSAKTILSPALAEACVVADGQLVERFAYIDKMRASRERAQETAQSTSHYTAEQLAGSTVLVLNGHLFDHGALNQTLDVLEDAGASFAIVDLDVSPNQQNSLSTTTAWLQVSVAGGRDSLVRVLESIEELAASTPQASMTVRENKVYCAGQYGRTLDTATTTGGTGATVTARATDPTSEVVLVLGAGLVAGPAVELLSRHPSRKVVRFQIIRNART